ncbi:hypothetical protein GF312_19870 [Candidatus Poribacteria bacterium]|nr:hypothetical protein [Candidatus Poribacteria bacterium]
MYIKLFIGFLVLLTTINYLALAEDIQVIASVDRKVVRVADVITFTIRILGSQSASVPDLPDIEGLQTKYVGPRTQISIINNKSSLSVSHVYRMVAVKTGTYTIPSLSIQHEGKTYRTRAINVQVTAGSAPQDKATTAEELKRYIRLVINTESKTAYVNESIPLKISLYIRRGVEVENIRYPTFPSVGFSVIPFEDAVRRRASVDGILYMVYDFPTIISPVNSGELTLGPAGIDCDLVVNSSQSRDPFFDSFFDRRARYSLTVKSEAYNITVKPLPEAGKPDSFNGAVGQFEFNLVAKPVSLKVGEPITLTMTVKGVGNIDTVKMPVMGDLTDFKVYDPQVNTQKSGNKGEKIFEQVLIPRTARVSEIPAVKFSYFDPSPGIYKTLIKGPIAIDVAPSEEDQPFEIIEFTQGKAVKREVLGKDIVYIKDKPGTISHREGYLYNNTGFILVQLIPLLGLGFALFYQKRRERFTSDKAYARQYHAPKKARKGLEQAQKFMELGKYQDFCSRIFRTMQEYLGDRFNLPFAGITIEIVDELRQQGISEDILDKLSFFFQSCDVMRFAQSDIDMEKAREMLNTAKEVIEYLESNK